MTKFRRLKKKRKFKFRYILYLVIIYIVYSITFYFLTSKYLTINNEDFLKYMLSSSNHNLIYKYSKASFVNKILSYFNNVDITSPISLLSNTFSTSSSDDYSNLEELKKISHYIEDPFESTVTSPLVYIYNTHQLENYNSSNLEVYNITPNVMMTSYILREKLNDLGIPSIVETSDVTKMLSDNNWNYSKSYRVTRSLMEKIVLEQPTLNYFIDVHRDSVKRNSTTLTLGDKIYAKVLFVVGLDNSNYEPNLNFANKLSSMINEKVNGLSKGVLKKQGKGVNGVYNQDFSSNVILLEVGGVDNTIEEVTNTISVISEVIYQYIKEANNG